MRDDFANLNSETVDPERRQRYVAELFDNLAHKYDRFNRWVTFFRDDTWRRNTVELLDDQATGVILDLAAGTGNLAGQALKAGSRQVHVFDISRAMLAQAKSKLSDKNNYTGKVALEQGSANFLPYMNCSFNGVVSGFAMRNVFHFLDDVLNETFRVLKPGGRFAILELSRPETSLLRLGFRLHMRTIMPLIGRLATGQGAPFKYLYQTTMTFLSPTQFKQSLQNAGFVEIDFKSYLLGGIAIHYGKKSQ
ncbi:ubiquinone/menaquinone biosynthesis methyltransferase [candidate division KSB1 bacterium]|nr:ubiquinone/menaquinone biosynthesis methyltransferase [candidate division KSB1 bacterium]NIR69456.1 ubiquinone/menaquinone biosynthesis methyltransferase [candidate division KSB1 bacterium]NIS22805.1 ubiquinone/menaquinone biosynthesis methyltransferase [candidate division KSB1 bacterium]NIT69645.1 ubiquinone/menaquinone biosynthesis methyltransferase [candidate division KSB1 bacterium]NIU23314.1 ubiquinone/menaquinone biosynthesis methyltransferase [candidate division KSB1 bacterium]